MNWDHVIRNGTIVETSGLYGADIYIKNEKIAAISHENLGGFVKKETDAKGCYVLPGLIDTHIHSRDPGATHKEDFYHSTQAAAAGGITTVFEMPNSNPPVNNTDNFFKQVENLQQKAHVDFALWGICLGHINLQDIRALNDAGVIGFKFFWGYAVHSQTYQLIYNYRSGMQDVIPPFKDGEVFDIFKEVARTGKLLAIHAENNDLIQSFTQKIERSGRTDYDSLLEARPNLVEETTIQTAIAFSKTTGARLHILHITTGEGVDLVKKAQEDGYAVTAETCPHYLFISNEDYEKIGSQMKVYPPVKYQRDQDRLWQGIKERTVSLVCSDHAPHTEDEKDGDLWSIPAGMCGVETLAPLMIDAVSKGTITIQDLVELLSENPAKLFGVYPQKGSLQIGTDADITIIDLNKKHKIAKENLHSKSKVTAFDGFEVTGFPVATIVRGQTVMENGVILGKPKGCFVKPEKN